MADLTYTSTTPAGVPNATKQVTDEHATRGKIPVVKLAYSATGDDTHITADANGLEVQLGSPIPAGTNNIGDVDILTVPTDPFGANADAASATGSISAKLRFIAATGIPITSTVTVTGAVGGDGTAGSPSSGVMTIQGTSGMTAVAVSQATAANLNMTEASAANILTAVQLIDDPVFADDAGFTVGTHKVTMGGRVAVAHGTNPDAADANDAVASLANRHRIPFMLGGHPNIISREYRATSAQTDDDMLGAISAGTKYVITGIAVMADKANTVDVGVRIGFGATTIPSEPADGAGVSGVILSHPGIAAGSGVVQGFSGGIIGIGGDGEELRITNEVPTSGSIKVLITYFTIES